MLSAMGLLPLIFSAQIYLAPVAGDDAKKQVVVPFELMPSGHIAVMAKINGVGPFRLGFDTGSPLTFVNRTTGKKIGLIKSSIIQSNSLLPAGQGTVNSFALETADSGAISVMVMDHPVVELISQVEGGLNGLVGFSYYGKFITTIDYSAKTITFVSNDYKPADVMGSVMKRYMKNSGGGGTLAPNAVWGFTVIAPINKSAGVVVTTVAKGGPADGVLRPGDRILTIEGRWTDSVREAFTAISEIGSGRPIELKVKRRGKVEYIKITPAMGI